MEYTDLYDRFLQVEADMDPFSVTVDDVPVWERIRLPVFRTVLQQVGAWGQEIQTLEKNVPNVIKGGYLLVKNTVHRNPFFADPADVLFFGFERRKQLDDGTYWDLFCDPLYDALKLDYLHLETPHLNSHLRPARTERLRYLELIEYTGTLIRELSLVDVTISGEERAALDRVTDRLASEFDVEIDITKRAEFRLELRASTRPLYRRLLERLNPELVFVVISFQKETFIEVCKQLDIPVVELQHGIPTHYEYSYPGDRTKETFPDYFFSFGEYWTDRVELPIPDEHIWPIGYAHFERQRSRLRHTAKNDRLVFISQGNVGAELSKAAVELAGHPKIDPTSIVYKLHPGEYGRWQRDYPWLRDADITVVGGEGPTLYELFARASAQVGVYSTAVYEGLGFGLATYLYNLPGVSEITDLCSSGYAELVSTPDELATAFTQRQSQDIDPSVFFSKNPLENFVTAVQDIESKHDLDIDIEKA